MEIEQPLPPTSPPVRPGISRRTLLGGMVAAGAGFGLLATPGAAAAAPGDEWIGFIMSSNNGNVMDVAGGSTADGAGIIQWPLHGGANQIFRFEYLGGGRYRIVATHSGKVLTIAGGSTADGVPLVQSPWNGGLNQQFIAPNYGWQPNPLIRVLHTRRASALQPEGGSAAIGARIVQLRENNATAAQRWRWQSASLIAAHSGLVVYAPGRGRQVYQVPFGQRSGSLAPQLFRIEGIAGGGNGFYRILSGTGSGSDVLAVPGGAPDDGAPVVAEAWGGTSGQLWRIEPVSNQPGLHRVVNAQSEKVLDVAGGSRTEGALVLQWRWTGAPNQLWRL